MRQPIARKGSEMVAMERRRLVDEILKLLREADRALTRQELVERLLHAERAGQLDEGLVREAVWELISGRQAELTNERGVRAVARA